MLSGFYTVYSSLFLALGKRKQFNCYENLILNNDIEKLKQFIK